LVKKLKIMRQIILDKKEQVIQLCKVYDIDEMYIFGSAVAGVSSAQSDIDFLISFKDIPVEKYTNNYFDLHYKLEELFSCSIDLITVNSVSNPYLIESIEETKELLYAA
jgi:predicted nucleotidyltransferase